MNPISLMELEKEWDKMNQAEIDQFVAYINKKLIKGQYEILTPSIAYSETYDDMDYKHIYRESDKFKKAFLNDVLDKYRNLGYNVVISHEMMDIPSKSSPTNKKWYEFWKDKIEFIPQKAPLKVLTITPKLEKK